MLYNVGDIVSSSGLSVNSNSIVIQSKRLDLLRLDPDTLRLTLAGDSVAVERRLSLTVPSEWYAADMLIHLRLQQLLNDPAYQPWSVRAIALREERQMVGHIGFHTKPGAPYLQPYAPDGIEFGYTVFSPFRRRGYAREACPALMQWAHEEHQVSQFVVTISPDNIPSRRLAEKLGFTKVGEHMDEEDGLEEIFRLDYRRAEMWEEL